MARCGWELYKLDAQPIIVQCESCNQHCTNVLQIVFVLSNCDFAMHPQGVHAPRSNTVYNRYKYYCIGINIHYNDCLEGC